MQGYCGCAMPLSRTLRNAHLDPFKTLLSSLISLVDQHISFARMAVCGIGYIRGGDAAFMGLDKKTGWRGGRRLLRELGHGIYLMWMLLNFTFVWAVGVSRFTDNKHNISDIEGGWLLGFAFAIIYAARGTCLHKYVIMHDVRAIDRLQRASKAVAGHTPSVASPSPVPTV